MKLYKLTALLQITTFVLAERFVDILLLYARYVDNVFIAGSEMDKKIAAETLK